MTCNHAAVSHRLRDRPFGQRPSTPIDARPTLFAYSRQASLYVRSAAPLPTATTSVGTISSTGIGRGALSSAILFLRYRRIGLPGMLRARRIDIGPRARTSGPDVSGNLHVAWVVERSDPQHSGLGDRGTLAVDGRPAVTAEVAVERATAIGRDDEALRCALRNVQGCSGNHRINAAA